MPKEEIRDQPSSDVTIVKPLSTMKSHFQEFSSHTSLHGVQYVGDVTRPKLERLCWIIAVCISVATCSVLIYNVYMKWVTSPIIVTFAETTTAVRSIPFPAVTICSGNKVRKSFFDIKTIKKRGNITKEENEKFGYASIMCQHDMLTDELPKIVDERAVDFITNAGISIDEMLMKCKWRSSRTECNSMFTSILTDVGLCHTFNMVNREDMFTDEVDEHQYEKFLRHNYSSAGWSWETGYVESNELDYPARVSQSGSDEGLTFYYLEWNHELVDSCQFPAFGFKVLIHSPVDFPQVNLQYFRIPPGHDVVVAVTPTMMTTSEGLQEKFSPTQRQCYLSHERKLQFFKFYSEANCDLECFINATLEICNCSAFYMPRVPNTPICGPGSNECLKDVRAALHVMKEMTPEFCTCLPSCTDIQYNVEVSETKVQWERFLDDIPYEDVKIGRVSIYFKRNRFITSRRNELYGMTDFIANCGGLLGLFMGFSFLSLVEVIYFLLLRPGATILGSLRRRQRERTAEDRDA